MKRAPRDLTLRVRIDDDTDAALTRAAADDECSVSGWVRVTLRAELRRRGLLGTTARRAA
jgi:predicted HicB family RNase H-like nuclease